LGIEQAHIKKGSPRLNGKMERSHRTDSEEFNKLFLYKGDVDFKEKFEEEDNFYNFRRPYKGKGGATPYETLRQKMSLSDV